MSGVAASARLLLSVPGSDDDALRRALAKLDAALGSREAVGLDVDARQTAVAEISKACVFAVCRNVKRYSSELRAVSSATRSSSDNRGSFLFSCI